MIGTQVGPFTVVRPLGEAGMVNGHDVGPRTGSARLMVLDYLDGGTLGQLMAQHAGPMPAQLIVHILSEIANGLQVAHERQIVHCDLTPEHVVLMVRKGDPHHAVLLDFGAAALGDEGIAGPRTRSEGVIGTAAYRPPEQLCGSKVSPAADIYALGVIAYQMSTGGWFPFQYGESRAGHVELPATELYRRQVTGPPVDPRDRVPRLGAAWASAVLAALSADPAQRPDSARAFARRLAEAAPVEPRRTPYPGVAPVCDGGSRYQLGETLGAGGMAEVFAGTMIGAEGFARRVAIKRVLPGLSQVPAFAAMFIAEARIASRLAHPNIVSVLDFARDPEDRLFLVMEYVDGKDLASLLESGPVTPSLAIFIAVEMLRALGYAHELPDPDSGIRGVVHRDVSPQNLLLSYEGAVKISDFGLAKARAASSGVRSDTVRGKPRYMSPEQMSGGLLDGRTDLYAVGVMLWEMLAHRSLFAGTVKEILAQAMFRGVPRPVGGGRRVPADLAAVAMKLLSPDPRDRYPTAAAAIDALLRCKDAPRDGRGELVHLLAERFPAAAGTRAPARPAAGVVRTSRVEQITLAAPPRAAAASGWMRAAFPSARRSGAWRWLLIALGLAAAAAIGIARTRGGPSGAAGAARERPHVPTAAREPVEPDRVAGIAMGNPVETGADAGRSAAAPTARVAVPARSRSVSRREQERAPQTGELAIVVTPWAMVWLNGKPSGQTPFRAVVPAGQYRVRIANEDVGHDETTILTVAPDRSATLERTW